MIKILILARMIYDYLRSMQRSEINQTRALEV